MHGFWPKALLAFAVCSLAASAQASEIAFAAAIPTASAATDVLLGGTLDRAYDFNNAGNLTINGVPFTSFETNTNGDTTTLGSGYNGYGMDGQPGDYGTLLSNGIYNDGGAQQVSFHNLTPNALYTIEVFVNDARQPGCCGGLRSETVSGDSATGTGTVFYDGPAGPAGEHIYGTFTSDVSGVQVLNLNEFGTNTGNAQINGVVLSFTAVAVPEPSSLVLIGLGAIGLFFVAHRKQGN